MLSGRALFLEKGIQLLPTLSSYYRFCPFLLPRPTFRTSPGEWRNVGLEMESIQGTSRFDKNRSSWRTYLWK